jgi:hypothetical protein
MHAFMYGITGLFWVICYVVAIWICVIGKKKNPNKGWNFIITAEVIYIIEYIPSFYYRFLAYKFPSVFWLTYSKYVTYIMWFLILPVGMILALIGLYHIAQGKKRRSKKTIKKRRVK